MAVTLNARFTNCLYYKIIVVSDVVVKYFWSIGPTARVSGKLLA